MVCVLTIDKGTDILSVFCTGNRNIYKSELTLIGLMLHQGQKVREIVFYTAEVHFVKHDKCQSVGAKPCSVERAGELFGGIHLAEFVVITEKLILVSPRRLDLNDIANRAERLGYYLGQAGLTRSAHTLKNSQTRSSESRKESGYAFSRIEEVIL